MIIGRRKELEILNNTLLDNSSHFIAIYGRRRIGRTYLIKETFGNNFCFQHAGLFNGTMKEQLKSFENSLREYGYNKKCKINCWVDAFEKLKELIKASNYNKKIIFIDELSWMDTQKCDLLIALENFWNGFACLRNDVILIACASATSWILNKIIHNKGGLYNRLTERTHLQSFNLFECEEYVRSKDISFNRMQILECYMIFGGVPYYWNFLKKEKKVYHKILMIFF